MAAASQDLIFKFLGIDAGAGREFDRMAGKASRFGSVGSKALLGIGAAAAVVAVESIKAASSFQSAMELIHTQAGASQGEVDRLSKAVLGLAGKTATAPDELAKGLYHLESTGLRGAAAMNALKIAAEGAKVGQANLEDVTNALNAVIASGIKGAGNLTEAMGALNATVGAGDMRMQDLAEALGTGVLAVVKGFGVSLRDTGAALAVFGDNNIRGADAATQLRMSVLFLAQGTKNADTVLGKIGLTTGRLRDDLAKGGLNKALTDLHTHLVASGNTGAKMGNILLEAFGKKAGVGLSVLESQFARFQSKFEEVHAGAKNFGSDWQATTKTFAFHMQQIRAEAEAASVYVGTYLIKALNGVFSAVGTVSHALETTVGWFDHNKVAAGALAGVMTAALLPALVEATAALGEIIALNAGLAFVVISDAVMGLVGSLTLAGGAAVVAAAALGAGLVVAWQHTAKVEKEARKAADDYFSSLGVNTTRLASVNTGLHQIAVHIDEVRHAGIKAGDVTRYGLAGDKTQSQVDRLRQHYGQLSAQSKALTATETTLARTFGISRGQVEALANAHGIDLSKGVAASADAIAGLLDAARLSHHPVQQAKDDIKAMGDSSKTAADQVKALRDSLDLLAGKALSADEAAITFRNNIAQLSQALHHSHGSMSLNTQAGRDARSQFDQTAQSALDLSVSIKDSTRSTVKAREALHRSIKALQDTAGNSDTAKAAIRRLQDAYNNLGPAAVKETAKANAAVARQAGAAKVAAALVGHQLGAGLVLGMQAMEGAVSTESKIIVDQAVKGMRLKAALGSPSKVTRYIGKMLAEGLIGGWTGEAGRIKHLLGTDVENALNALTSRALTVLNRQRGILKAAQSQLHQDLASRAADTANLAGSIAGPADLSGAFTQDAAGNTVLGNVGQFASAQVAPLQQFAADLKWAAKHHLNPVDLAQIANMGAAQGDQILRQLMSGQSSISTLNTAQGLIAKYSTAAAGAVEGSVYAGQIARDRKNIHEQTVTLHRIERVLHAIERKAARDIASHVTITVDAKGRMKLTQEDGREIVRELRALAKQGIKP